jgi:hypothetical protein
MLCQYKCEQLDTVSWEYVHRNCSLMTISGNETPGPKFMPVTFTTEEMMTVGKSHKWVH